MDPRTWLLTLVMTSAGKHKAYITRSLNWPGVHKDREKTFSSDVDISGLPKCRGRLQ